MIREGVIFKAQLSILHSSSSYVGSTRISGRLVCFSWERLGDERPYRQRARQEMSLAFKPSSSSSSAALTILPGRIGWMEVFDIFPLFWREEETFFWLVFIYSSSSSALNNIEGSFLTFYINISLYYLVQDHYSARQTSIQFGLAYKLCRMISLVLIVFAFPQFEFCD